MENSGTEETTNAQTLLFGKSTGYVKRRCRDAIQNCGSYE